MIRKTSALLIPALAGLVAVAGAQQAPKVELTARELFYAAVESPKPKAPAKTQVRKAPPKTVAKTETHQAPPPAAAPVKRSPATADGGFIQLASERTSAPAPSTGAPLGLKCTILKLVGSEMQPVPADAVFHAGDKIQLQIQANSPGYLYIIAKGSSGTWAPLFPSRDVADANNHVDGWHTYTLPPRRMVFDEQTGTERLFIVFSRAPENDLENTIYSLQGAKAQPAAAPAPAPAAKPKQLLLTASVDDATVGRLRNTFSRDLVIEKVDESTPAPTGEQKETAVYVVNPSGSSDSRVVADLALVHQ
jgi:hypothetical protein